MEQIILIGCGGHADSVMDSIVQQGKYRIAGFIERENYSETENSKFPVIGTDSDLQAVYDSGIRNAFVTIGYLGKGDTREKIYHGLKQIGYNLPKIIDSSAVLAGCVRIGEGTYVGKRAVVNTDANIGKMCIINTGAVVEHGNDIGDFCHVAVGSVLCGGVSIGRKTLVGANATILQNVNIGKEAIIGAGTVVRHDVEMGQTYYGR